MPLKLSYRPNSIHHQQEPLLESIDEQILHDSALFIEQTGVQRPTRRSLVRHRLAGAAKFCSNSREPQFTHVAHVE